MRVIPESGMLTLQGREAFQRCLLQDTLLVGDVVTLASTPPPAPSADTAGPFTGGFAGLAFDRRCRLFHARPDAAQVENVLWGRTGSAGANDGTPHPWPITAAGTEVDGAPTGALPQTPVALACDAQDYLYIADPAALTVWLVDVWQQEVARAFDFDHAPQDLATCDDALYVLLDDGSTWQLAPCDDPHRTPWPLCAGAKRLCVARTPKRKPQAWVLRAPGTGAAELQALHLTLTVPAPFCTDIAFERLDANGLAVLVLAQRPGENFTRLQIDGKTALALPAGLSAPHYDGRGIEPAPDGRLAYWTVHGVLRHAAPARAHYLTRGRLFAFGLDSDRDQSSWGRVRVEACIPAGTALQLYAFSADDTDANDPMPGAPHSAEAPALSLAAWALRRPDAQPLFLDPSARPLAPAPADGFAWFDAPVPAGPGRHLWLVFEFAGTRSKSPRLRSVVVDYPGHGLLQQLPRTLWRGQAERDFLFRLLMPIAAMLDEWAAVGEDRHRLLDPRITPAPALPWLAGFVGLVVEPCWSEAAQRRLVAAAARLFRTRGTQDSLREMIELLTDAQVLIVEQFRLRGGGVIGNPASIASQAVLGGGYRVGGMIGELKPGPLDGAPEVDFDDFAHRFTVIVVARLSDEQLDCVRRLIDHHKPAHTDFTLCTADTGLRAGVGAHVGLSAVVGRSGGFEPALVGDLALGAGYVLGRPELGSGGRE